MELERSSKHSGAAGTSWLLHRRSMFLTALFLLSVTANLRCVECSHSRRTYNSDGEVLSEEGLLKQCYHFTWVGLEEAFTNETNNCNVFDAKSQPCFEPLVYTSGPNQLNGPDLDQLEELCETEGNTEGEICIPTCHPREGQTCVKMTYYLRNQDNTIAYETHFCGEGVMTSDNGKFIERGCHVHRKTGPDERYDLETCFCPEDRCNGSPRIKNQAIVAAVAAAAVLLFNLGPV